MKRLIPDIYCFMLLNIEKTRADGKFGVKGKRLRPFTFVCLFVFLLEVLCLVKEQSLVALQSKGKSQ